MIGYREDEEDKYLAECILEYPHNGPHVVKTPEGKFFAWEDDMECDCCGDDEYDRCAVYWEIEESDIPNLSKKQT
jgi:hypothetical protein